MAAWVIRQEREGEPVDAFQVEEIEVPEPGAFEVIVRVMAAGRELQQRLGRARQAGLRLPLPPRRGPPHRRLGRLGHRLEGRPGRDPLEARRRGRHPLQPGLLRGPRGPRPRPARRAVAADLGLRDELGLVRAVHEGPGPAAAAQAGEPRLGGGRVLRPDLLHRLPDADRPRAAAGRPTRADLGRRRRPRRVRDAARRRGRRPSASASSPRAEKGALVEQLGARRLHRPQRVRRA